MKPIHLTLATLAGIVVTTITAAQAAPPAVGTMPAPKAVAPTDVKVIDGTRVSDVSIRREGSELIVRLTLDLKDIQVPSNRAVLLTPQLSDSTHLEDMQSVGIYGRRRYYYYMRNDAMLSADEYSYLASRRPATITYDAILPYENWMNGATLLLNRTDYGCCSTAIDAETGVLTDYFDRSSYVPRLIYVAPQTVSEKRFNLEGRANIAFLVNKTSINPSYGNNAYELAKIYATIDSVKVDPDVTITDIHLKGYASPEGSYASNERLAAGRTAAIKDYIRAIYDLSDAQLIAESEPEDWQGVTDYLLASDLADRDAILDIIRSESEPDKREQLIRQKYPKSYATLLADCYPALRHTDYRVSYTVRAFTDVAEIKRIFDENPGKLSLNELFLLAQTYEPGTSEYNHTLAVAASLYPDDAVANLNAGNVALSRGDLIMAADCLSRAGDSAEADYARGVLALMQDDDEAATRYLLRAKQDGIGEADDILNILKH